MTDIEPKAPHAKCNECPLADKRCAPTIGDPNSKVAFVSRSPGKYDVMVGKPFANPNGTKPVLEHLLRIYGVNRNDVITTNVVLCQSDDPPAEAIAACRPRLEAEIANCELVIAAGTEAVISLTKYRAIHTARPFVHNRTSSAGVKQRVIATNNPALVIRDSDSYPDMVQDFKRAFDPIPPPVFPTVEIINDRDKARDILRRWLKTDFNSVIASDLEWRSTTNEPICAGFSARASKAVVFGHGAIRDDSTFDLLQRFYERRDIEFCWHNGKADTKVLRTANINARVDEDTFLMSYCHVPGTKILLSNLTWKNIEDLEPFVDELIAFDEQNIPVMKPAQVLEKLLHEDDCYEVITEKGSMVVSGGHLWPVGRGGNKRRVWVTTEDLQSRMANRPSYYTLTYLADPWEFDDSYESGYVAGILDGEGHLVKEGGPSLAHINMYRLGFSQKKGVVLNRTLEYLSKRNVQYTVYESSRHDDVMRVKIGGGVGGLLRTLGLFRPNRFLQAGTNHLWEGARKLESVKILSIKYVGKRTVVGISTDTNTLIADGFFSHNCLDERPGYHTLEYLLSTQFGWPDYEPPSVKSFKKTGEFYGKTPQEKARSEFELYKYNGWDTAGTLQLNSLLSSKLETDRGGSVRPLYKRLLHAAERFTTVELNGFNYDALEAANINDAVAIPQTIELTNELRRVSDHALLNPKSPQQLAVVYYDDFGLKHKLRDMGKKKFARSTGKEVREEILDGRVQYKIGKGNKLREFAEYHRAFAKIIKLRANYLEGLILRTQVDGKLYCHFNIGGTVSGRTSSSKPNLQNIAREGYAEIPGIRTLFTGSSGCSIVSADYSQAELRTCAKLSGEPNLLDIYRDGSRSLHKERAAAFYGASYTYEEYVKAKNINFGVTYGQGADAFAQMYHMPKGEAQNYIDSWWNEFSTLKEWTLELQKQALTDGYVQSPFGHKRRFSLITNDNIGDVRREAVSSLPQNIAAWLTICALCDLVDSGVRVVATVHDSIVADIPDNEVDEVARLMKDTMAIQPIKQLGWAADDIPFLADISVGSNWGTLEELDLKVAA